MVHFILTSEILKLEANTLMILYCVDQEFPRATIV